jgi:hypothetical protein
MPKENAVSEVLPQLQLYALSCKRYYIVSWSKILRYWDRNVDWGNVHTCFELGGRQGGLVLWLTLKGKVVVCSDISNTREAAEILHTKYNVNTLMTYQDIDATDIPYENYFDIVVFKSIIGGIGRNNNMEMQQKVFDKIDLFDNPIKDGVQN